MVVRVGADSDCRGGRTAVFRLRGLAPSSLGHRVADQEREQEHPARRDDHDDPEDDATDKAHALNMSTTRATRNPRCAEK